VFVYVHHIHLGMLDLENIIGFEWDEGNKYKNEKKHSILQKEAEEIFINFPLLVSKSENKNDEDRWMAYGKSNENKPLTVVFVVREKKIRITSARPQSKKERRVYNEAEERIKANPGL
jgi:uncharacterized protein